MSCDEKKFLEFAETVTKIKYDDNDTVIVCGDFNQSGIKRIKADDGDYYLPMNVTTEGGVAVIDTMLGCGFHQMCNLENAAGNVLDLVFTNRFYDLSLSESLTPLIETDVWHKAIEVEITIDENESELNDVTEFYKYEAADFVAMNEFFVGRDISTEIEQQDDIENSFRMFENVVYEAMDKFVPKVTVEKSTDPPWYNKQLKNLNNRKRKAHGRSKITNDFADYMAITDSFVALQGQLFQTYISRIQSDIKSNPKHFWRFVNDRRKRSEIPSIVEYNNQTAISDASKAELFANFFESQYIPSDDIDLDNLLSECGDNAFDIELNEADVLKALLSINVNKGAGPDIIASGNCAKHFEKRENNTDF
ncbi:uncharacterized protein LOC129575914 [Sitodiplosis mosellana]|uniref:uncharacterized protein LOC129575914 n=1 Tax=Sitodiplosis mosellana TaxID=263140 RepID=UPI002444E5D0|nr:uncharacterized protein LOC129575914 [Sitodiplosis mosellana]